MGEKRKQVYHALVEGASNGLADAALYAYVVKMSPKTSSKRIVRAALLALSDPDIRDRKVLDAIYALAIKHRLDDLGAADDVENDDPATPAPFLDAPPPAGMAMTVHTDTK